MKRLLKKAGASPFAKSRPVYGVGQHRALHTLFKPTNLARERGYARAGSTHVVRADVSHFYPSLYTHAIGWAIDPKLRQRVHWRNAGLLGKRLDQALMDMQGKVSQGVPIGNDISFLLSEIVLCQVDRAMRVDPARAARWYDDYEISCDSAAEAARVTERLRRELGRFQLRLNPAKTAVRELPESLQPPWREALAAAASG